METERENQLRELFESEIKSELEWHSSFRSLTDNNLWFSLQANYQELNGDDARFLVELWHKSQGE
jgi:hypothetical protein